MLAVSKILAQPLVKVLEPVLRLMSLFVDVQPQKLEPNLLTT